ncbi:hypothetical protein MTO96_025012 [Rhipicephalus appendiculatus]
MACMQASRVSLCWRSTPAFSSEGLRRHGDRHQPLARRAPVTSPLNNGKPRNAHSHPGSSQSQHRRPCQRGATTPGGRTRRRPSRRLPTDTRTEQDSWRCSLRMKFKNQRRTLSNDTRVAENRRKFATSRKPDDNSAADELKRHKKRKMDIDIFCLAGEDENSLAKHEEWLRAEAFNAAPEEEMIHNRMDFTAKRRLLEVAEMSIASVRRKYPYLMDFGRDERMPQTPCVVYSGPSLERAEFLHLHVDNQNIFPVSNAEEGVTALMSAFFIFNIVYGRKAFNTSTVLERLFLGMSKTSPRDVAIKKLAVQEWQPIIGVPLYLAIIPARTNDGLVPRRVLLALAAAKLIAGVVELALAAAEFALAAAEFNLAAAEFNLAAAEFDWAAAELAMAAAKVQVA